MRAQSFLRSVLGSGVQLVKVDAPIFCARYVRGRVHSGLLHADVRRPALRIFEDEAHVAEAAQHEDWQTLYVYEVRVLEDKRIALRADVDPGPFVCCHSGRCCCLWHPERKVARRGVR